MASGVNKLAESTTAASGSFTTSGSLTPSANKLYLAAVVGVNTAGAANASTCATPTLTGGGGLTWVQVATVLYGTDTRKRITLFRAMKPSGLTSGTLTADFGGSVPPRISIIVDEFDSVDTTGTDGSGAIVQSVTAQGSASNLTGGGATLAAFADATNNLAYMAIGHDQSDSTTPEAGWTELAEISGSSHSQETEYKVGQDTSPSASWVQGSRYGAIAAEIKNGAAPVTITPPVGIATADAVAPTVTRADVVVSPVGAATADSVVPGTTVALALTFGAATADAVAPTITSDLGPTPPPGVATADAVAPGLAVAFTVPTAAAATADAVSPVVAVYWNLTSPAGIATAEATAASLAVALVSPVGTATADAVAPTFLQRLITILEVVITQPRALGSTLYERVVSYVVTQPQSLGSTIHQRILAPVITAARDITSSIFRN